MFGVTVTQADVENFVEHLAGKGWVLARKLRTDLGINDRHSRALAEASKGRVISGNRGYKLTAEATAEERNECLHRLRHQADRMQARSSIIERVWQEAQPTATTAF
jgi:hypothetical protein